MKRFQTQLVLAFVLGLGIAFINVKITYAYVANKQWQFSSGT